MTVVYLTSKFALFCSYHFTFYEESFIINWFHHGDILPYYVEFLPVSTQDLPPFSCTEFKMEERIKR